METEVLAPAGSIEGLKAALYAGADAVYTGGRMFGARAYANNLSDEELSECIDYCHLHNKKIYLTTNTLMKQSEIYQLADWLVPFYEQGLDAVIVQDFGAFAFLKREFPNLDLHASTQMSVHSVQSAALLEKLGAPELFRQERSAWRRSQRSGRILLWKSNVLCTGHFVTVIPVSV